MASLKLEHIYKVYPNGTKAVNDISLDIANGEFIVFVGPSGCGKSTTLRMIAGLEEISAGELYIDNRIVNDMEPKDRDIAMVFQNYALYPHMSVYENMAFGLKLRHVPDDVIQEKVLWASEVLGIRDYLDRKPRNMSGGQRQRVALGRAILRDPKVMLLDEPLSNLDAKLRTQMRTEIAKLHQKLKTTFIYVTHDQTEAMTLGDRVVVMKLGRIQQVDTPKNLYDYPSNVFVAGFIGTPQMNFFSGTLLRKGEKVSVHLDENGQDLLIDYNHLIKVDPRYLDGKHPVTIGIRCEHVHLTDEKDPSAIKVQVSHFEELGADCLIYGSLANDENDITSSKGQIIIKVNTLEGIKGKEEIFVRFDMEHTYFFDKETEDTIVPRIPAENNIEASVQDGKLSFLGVELPLPEAIRCEDVTDALLSIPTDAIRLGTGEIVAKVLSNEHVGKVNLVHLLLGGRVLFAQSDKDYEIDSQLPLSLDFTRLSLMDGEKVLISPLAEFDSFSALFYNYQTVMNKKPDEHFKEYRDNKIKAASDYFEAKEKILEEDYKKKIQDVGNGIGLLKEGEAEKNISENNAKIAQIKSDLRAKLKQLKDKFLLDKKEAKRKNDEIFLAKKMAEEEEFRKFKASNKDKETLKRRTDEYHIFKDNFATDRDNALTLTVNGITMDYESKVSTLRASHRREIELLKKENKEWKRKESFSKDPKKDLEKGHKKELQDLKKAKESQLLRAGMVFFFRFPGEFYELTGDIIANKLIQGLGTRVFTKDFLVELPHDAYVVSKDGRGLSCTVEKNLDYRDVYFAQCSFVDDNGEKRTLYVKCDKPMEVGKDVILTFLLEKARITETDMNIRLY